MLGAIVGERQFGHVPIPGLLVLRDALGYHSFYDPVRSLHGVALRCIRRGRLVLNVPCFGEVFELVARELAAVVGNYNVRASVYLFQLGNSWWSLFFESDVPIPIR